jgi:hypothetical protein
MMEVNCSIFSLLFSEMSTFVMVMGCYHASTTVDVLLCWALSDVRLLGYYYFGVGLDATVAATTVIIISPVAWKGLYKQYFPEIWNAASSVAFPVWCSYNLCSYWDSLPYSCITSVCYYQ